MDLQSYLLGKKSGGGGTSDYSELSNKPSINGVTLSGNKTNSDLGLGDSIKYYYIDYDDSESQYTEYFTQWLNDYKNGIKDIIFCKKNNYSYAIIFINVSYNNGNGQITLYTPFIYDGDTPTTYGIAYTTLKSTYKTATISNDAISNVSTWQNVNTYYGIKGQTRKMVAYDNTTEFTPSGNYNLVHKKYVDDSISAAITGALGGSY